jgi:hypothetical protein
MFQKFIHFLMIVSVLACPTLCGPCCDAAEMGEAIEVTAAAHGACSCHEQPTTDSQPPPCHGDCPQECHDCFCEGALPVGVSVTALLDSEPLAVEFTVVTPTHTITSLDLAALRCDSGPPPVELGQRLATLCTLLI